MKKGEAISQLPQDIPRRGEGGIPCRREQRQRMTGQRRNCPESCVGTSAKKCTASRVLTPEHYKWTAETSNISKYIQKAKIPMIL
jgi:hypothetical protein